MSTIICNGPCKRELEHSEENFYVLHGRLRIRCKQCHGLAVKKWAKSHPEHYENYQKKWVKKSKAANPEIWKIRQWIQDLKKMGVTEEWYLGKMEEQNGVCAICYRPETNIHPRTGEVQRLAIDHDHKCCPGDKSCGKCVRGLLCSRCNPSVAILEEVEGWEIKANKYLQSYQKDNLTQSTVLV